MQLYILFGDLPKCLSSVRCLESSNSHGCAVGKVCQLLMAVNKENESSQVALANVIVCCHWKGVILFPSRLAHALLPFTLRQLSCLSDLSSLHLLP